MSQTTDNPTVARAAMVPSRRQWLALSAFVLALGGVAYALLGNQAGWSVAPGGPASPAPVAAPPRGKPMDIAEIKERTAKLAKRLEENPDDALGWAMLARGYRAQGRHTDALPAYQKAIALRPSEAQYYVELADAKRMVQNRSWAGDPEALVAKALTLDGRHVPALHLAGTIALQKGDMATAERHWKAALSFAEPGSEWGRAAQAGLHRLRDATQQEAPAGPAELAGRVSLAAALRDQAAPDDTVFIVARSAEGPNAPLAIARKQVKDLPVEFKLNDSLAMLPTAKLSGAAQVVVSARISKSGSATAQPGDLLGQSAPLSPTSAAARKLSIDINQRLE